MMHQLTCFKAYDIRGRLGDELNEEIACRIGRAYAKYMGARRVVVGSDIRLSSPSIKQAVVHGLMQAGTDVIDIGMAGTEEVYFATFHLGADGGIEVTASHNPIDYNGMKLVGRDARPISSDTGLNQIQHIAENQHFTKSDTPGSFEQMSVLDPYIQHLLGYIDPTKLRPLRLVVNTGNSAAGHVIDAIEDQFHQQNVPIELVKIHHEPDGEFPNGIPNPLLPENRTTTAEMVKKHQADMGIAWDGDFDRCFLFDERGEFIEGYYIVGLLAESFLRKHPGETIIHDPRLTWNTIDIAQKAGGIPIQSKAGHAFIKQSMRAENAIYGGEMSAHHYFRDFAYCDSGMIPWLLVAELISVTHKPLSALVGERMGQYPCSGELNYSVQDAQSGIEAVKRHFQNRAVLHIDTTDGLGMEFADWRFNLRASNTEPLLRLNVESRADHAKVADAVAEIEAILR